MKRTWRVAIALAALLAFPGAHAGGSEPALELQAVGMIDVGPDGSVHDYRLKTKLEPAVAALVDRTVRGWRFEPVLEDGRPVIATTRMRLELEALPRDDGYALRVADVAFGEPEAGGNPPPPFPRGLQVDARVRLLLQVAADGRVRDVHVEQVSLGDRMGKRSSAVRDAFARVTRETARSWSFDTGEIVDGEPVPMQLRVSVDFERRRVGGWNERPTFHPGPVHPAPWAKPATPRGEDGPVLAGGDLQRLGEPRVRLRDQVVGSLL